MAIRWVLLAAALLIVAPMFWKAFGPIREHGNAVEIRRRRLRRIQMSGLLSTPIFGIMTVLLVGRPGVPDWAGYVLWAVAMAFVVVMFVIGEVKLSRLEDEARSRKLAGT